MSVLDASLIILRLAIGFWLLWSVRFVRAVDHGRATAGEGYRDVQVVVPARDEEQSLPRLLASLPVGVDVVVVDDHSSDRTAEVARAAGATVVSAAPLPDGWAGKPWACAQAVEALGASSTDADLVFVDADVRFGRGGFEAVVEHLGRRGGLISVQPSHRPERAVEHLAMVFNIVAFAATDAGTPLGRRRGGRGAFGPVLATARSDYDSVGGHAAVRGEVVEDVALAERYRDAGHEVTVLAGGDAVAFRMYPEGFGQLVEGFTKNLAAGAGAVRKVTVALVVAWSTLLVQAAVAPVRAVAAGDGWALAVAAVVYVAVAAQCWWMARRVGRFAWWAAAAFPVCTAMFLAVFARSLWAAMRGEVSWRGRRIGTRRAR